MRRLKIDSIRALSLKFNSEDPVYEWYDESREWRPQKSGEARLFIPYHYTYQGKLRNGKPDGYEQLMRRN